MNAKDIDNVCAMLRDVLSASANKPLTDEQINTIIKLMSGLVSQAMQDLHRGADALEALVVELNRMANAQEIIVQQSNPIQ